MRVPPAQPAASRCRRSCDRHGSGIAQRLADAGDARVEDEAVHVRELAAQRAREAQVEEAVQAHRAADVEQQHQARAHAAALLPGQPQRRAAAGHAAPYRALQVETAAAMRARFAAQLRDASGAARSGASAPRCRAHARPGSSVAEVRRRQRLLAARAVPRGAGVVVAAPLRGARLRQPRVVAVAQRAGRLARAGSQRAIAVDEDLLVRRQEVGVEQRVEAPPFVAAPAQQRLEAPAQDLADRERRSARRSRARGWRPRRRRR